MLLVAKMGRMNTEHKRKVAGLGAAHQLGDLALGVHAAHVCKEHMPGWE